jgi:signal transduction histidine kinase
MVNIGERTIDMIRFSIEFLRSSARLLIPTRIRRLRHSIRSQLVVLITAVALPLLGLVFYSTYSDRKLAIEAVYASASDVALVTAVSVEEKLAESERLLRTIALRPLVRKVNAEQCDPFHYEFATLFRDYTSLNLADLDGYIICSTLLAPAETGPSIADRKWFQEVVRTQAFAVGEVTVGRLDDRWVSVLAYPVFDEQAELAGVLAIPIDLVRYQKYLDPEGLPPGTTITIIDGNSTVVARSVDPEQWVGQNVGGFEIVANILNGSASQGQGVSIDGVEKIYGVVPIAATDWHLYVGIPAHAAIAPLRTRLIQQLLTSLLIILLVTGLALYLMRGIERPVLSLKETAAAVAGGQLAARAVEIGALELTAVARQFNQMLDVNQQHRRQLERQASQLQALAQMGQAVASTLELPLLLERVLTHLDPLSPAEGSAVLLFGKQRAQVMAARGKLASVLKDGYLPMSTPPLDEICRQRQSLWRQNGDIEKHLFSAAASEGNFVIRSLQMAPLTLDGSVIGLLTIFHSDATALGLEDLRLLEAAASWTAIAVGNAHLYSQVSSSRERLRRLAQQVVSTEEEERQRLARELHDESGQSLIALKISLDLIKEDLPEELANIKSRLGEMADMTGQTMERLRAVSHHLRPPSLEAYGLHETLKGLCQDFAYQTQLAIDYQGSEIPDLPDTVAVTLYRLVQEALTNVAKHAQADQVQVTLRQLRNAAYVSVTDNGHGFVVEEKLTPTAKPAGLGLAGMSERIELLGGVLTISSQPQRGTKLEAHVPLA